MQNAVNMKAKSFKTYINIYSIKLRKSNRKRPSSKRTCDPI